MTGIAMSDSTATLGFADIIEPMAAEEFFGAYHDRAPLHVPGRPDKFASLMSWEKLAQLLNMTAIWTSASLQMALDKEIIPPDRYCRPAIDRNNQHVMQHDPSRVLTLLR